jgi:hypothetical protein
MRLQNFQNFGQNTGKKPETFGRLSVTASCYCHILLNVHLTSLLHKVVHTVKSVFRGHLWDN